MASLVQRRRPKARRRTSAPWARREKRNAGELLSELAREALIHRYRASAATEPEGFFGFEPLPSREKANFNELIDKLREDGSE